MEIVFLGTAAAEGWPGLFCECENCRRARKSGGRNIRTRSSIMMGNEYKVDFPPETLVQLQREKSSLSSLKHLFVTHHHRDHLDAEELLNKGHPFSRTAKDPLVVYGSAETIRKIEDIYALASQREQKEINLEETGIVLREITAGKEFTAGEMRVMPLAADHVPGSLIFLFQLGEKVILYGNDTGIFPEVAWKILANHTLDLVILDCTNGRLQNTNRAHMGIDGIETVVARMKREGMFKETTRLWATHFSHNGGLLQDELEERLTPLGVEVAFDGLRVRV